VVVGGFLPISPMSPAAGAMRHAGSFHKTSRHKFDPMKRLIQSTLVSATLVLGLLGAGCTSTEADHHHAAAPAGAAASTQKDAGAKTGLGCAQCTCHKFEPRVEDATICRMCWHAASAHTRQ